MKLWTMIALILLGSAVQAVQPVKVKGLASLSPGDEIVVSSSANTYRKGDALSLVDVIPGPEVVHARVVERIVTSKHKVRVVAEES
jgi:hypothetical protein